MTSQIAPLIREIYRQSALQRMPPPNVTRIVKLLYLADIEWRRRHDGKPLSNLTWKFLHFGPYAVELAEHLSGPNAETSEFETGKMARSLHFDPDEIRERQVPQEIESILSELVKKWGDADLNMLLDYVYFDTEPMEHAIRYQSLDFSSLRKPELKCIPKIDSSKVEQLRRIVRERTRCLKLTRDGVHVNSIDLESERAWDEDDRAVMLPLGARVRPSS